MVVPILIIRPENWMNIIDNCYPFVRFNHTKIIKGSIIALINRGTLRGGIMESIKAINSEDPKEHAQNIERFLYELKLFCRSEIHDVTEPKAKALFETTAEVLGGLEKAYSDYQSENEGAWVNDENRPTPM